MYILIIESIGLALVCLGLSFLKEKLEKDNKMPKWLEQTIYGVIFGGIACLFSQFGYSSSSNDVEIMMNVRDASVICAGLFFGWPAGLISGVIGGLYRYFSIYWGAGELTAIACASATLISGLASGAARKFMFKDHNPGIGFSIWIALGCETIDLLLIFLTNMDNIYLACRIARIVTFILMGFNTLAVLLSDIAVERMDLIRKPLRALRPSFTRNLNISFVALLLITGLTTYFISDKVGDYSVHNSLTHNINSAYSIITENGITDTIKNWNCYLYGGLVVYDAKTKDVISTSYCGTYIEPNDFIINKNDDKGAYEISDGVLECTMLDSHFQENIYYSYNEEDDYIVLAYLTVKEADTTVDTALYVTLYGEILIYATVLALVYQIVEKKMIKPIHQANRDLTSIANGDLSTIVDIKSSDEFIELSTDINSTVDSLKKLIDEAEHKNEKDLLLAKQIQMSSVPTSFDIFLRRKDMSVYALMETAKEVGGDFYDFYFIDDTHFAILIADVSGKGIPAAMFMMSAKTLIKSLAEAGKSVEVIFNEANKKLCENNEAEMFLTAWMGIIDTSTGILSFANAGHNPPLIYRKDKGYEYLKDKPNFIMAGMDMAKYVKHEIKLNPGDKIYLYTDGVTEATNPNNELFTEARLLSSLNEVKENEPKGTCEKLLQDIIDFRKEAPQSDDITMLSFSLNYVASPSSISIYPSDDSLDTVTNFIEKRLEGLNISSSIKNKVRITIDEVYSNFIKYGKASKASVSLSFDDDKLSLSFANNGEKFNPLDKDDPNITSNLNEREVGGLGIFLVKKLSSSISYEYKDNENRLNVGFDLKESNKGSK